MLFLITFVLKSNDLMNLETKLLKKTIVFMLIIGQFDHSIITGKTYLATMTILMFFVFMNRIDKKEINK